MIGFRKFTDANIAPSSLYDQTTFFHKFEKDLKKATHRVVIESPFITRKRVKSLFPELTRLRRRGVGIVINTKPLHEHDESMAEQALWAIAALQDIGVRVLMTSGHHRKIAIIDDIVYEGSLNILSQFDSCEIMRRIESKDATEQILRFTGVDKWLQVLL